MTVPTYCFTEGSCLAHFDKKNKECISCKIKENCRKASRKKKSSTMIKLDFNRSEKDIENLIEKWGN